MAGERDAGDRPTRVLQILTCDAMGGTEIMLSAMVERMDRAQVSTFVASLDAPGPIVARLRRSCVPVRSLGGRGFGIACIRLARLLRMHRFDVVNAYGFKSTFIVRFVLRLLSPETRFVSGVRGLHVTETQSVDAPKARLALWLDRRTARFVDIYDANSAGALGLLESVGVPRERLHYIPNGLDTRGWPAPARGERAIPAQVLCVARLVPRKRQADLVRASAMLQQAGVEHQLILAGWGPTLPEVERLAAELGVAESTTFTGGVAPDEVRRLLARTSVFCLASTWEGMAGSVMEAMAAGLPVVGTDVNGIADLVQDGVTGVLVPPEQPAALAAALSNLLASPELADTMGARGRRRIEKEFSLDRVVREKQALYQRLAREA